MRLSENKILVLNRSYFPLRIENVQQTFVNMAKATYHGVDFEYNQDEDGKYLLNDISSMLVVKTMKEWMELPIRECDEFIHTVKGPVRIPPVVLCATFNQIKFPKVCFPTNKNIFKRDNYICGYTGKKLTKDELSIDHIIPTSRGGKHTWENLVTCDRTLNGWKSDRTPKECGLKLKITPFKPSNGLVFELLRDEWGTFINNMP
jgi:hypothetical protein